MASVETGNMSREGERVDMLPNGEPENWMEYFEFKYSRDTPSDARNAVLVVAALLVQVTYQAGINPPDYIYKNKLTPEFSTFSLTVFLVVNTLSLSAAMTTIEYLTENMPYQREMRLATFCMMFGYGWSSCSTEPVTVTKTAFIVVASLVPYLARSVPNKLKKWSN
ncbi:PREDICTED: uncharacterized protein LOC109160855 [Ipomoea nil]|uniref:uncharacterized protein LOC109160855 n=1 Tax=Ipomoea nil TaxID=35883 RepID=UPI00090114FA|nr:PREDICTED: uncharacterized protein LOC109160855 [Ipomoea nil]